MTSYIKRSLDTALAQPALRPEETVLRAVWDSSRPSRVYWLMNGLATLIAAYGLLANSAAVVIGAMVVAMLLGPISGVALALNEGNQRLFWTALVSLVGGIVWIMVIGVMIGFIHRDVSLTAEILSRTDPRLFDLMIALAGGAAGAVAVVSPRVGSAIVGVAVATALVPPLAASGILLARGEFTLSGGALMLALTNVVAIEVAFSIVFWVGGYRRVTEIEAGNLWAFLRRNLLPILVLVGLAGALGVQLRQSISTSLFQGQVRAVLRQALPASGGYYLVDLRVSNAGNGTIIRAVVRGPRPPSATEVGTIEAALPTPPDGSRPHLRIRFVQVLIMTPQGPAIADDASGDAE